jgi:GT2 family glycosyltransferase
MTLPFFSIIIPTYDRPEELLACVQTLKQLDYPRDRFEIIIVDDGSRVPVNLSGHHNQDGITLLRQNRAGPASARNMGAEKARGEVLAFTDDDCRPSPQWLRELTNAFAHSPLSLIGGRTINGLAENYYSTASQIIVEEVYGYFFRRNSPLRFFASNNMALPVDLFKKCGGFDASFRTSEDRDFCDRWIRQGHPMVYVPEAIVYHYHHLTLTTFCRQHFNYGRGAWDFYRKRALYDRRFFRPDLRFYAAVFGRAFTLPISGKFLYTIGLMSVWQAANLAGFLWQGLSRWPSSVAGKFYKTLHS